MSDWSNFMSDAGSAAQGVGQVLDLVLKIKKMMQKGGSPQVSAPGPTMSMQSFQPQTQDHFQGGAQFVPQLQQMAAQNGNAWVPTQTQGYGGIDLTGLWVPPMNPMDQTYIRQFGPYLNFVAGVAGIPGAYAEGVIDPASGVVQAVGQYANGAGLQMQAQLFPNWTLQGWVAAILPSGQPMTTPLGIAKVA